MERLTLTTLQVGENLIEAYTKDMQTIVFRFVKGDVKVAREVSIATYAEYVRITRTDNKHTPNLFLDEDKGLWIGSKFDTTTEITSLTFGMYTTYPQVLEAVIPLDLVSAFITVSEHFKTGKYSPNELLGPVRVRMLEDKYIVQCADFHSTKMNARYQLGTFYTREDARLKQKLVNSHMGVGTYSNAEEFSRYLDKLCPRLSKQRYKSDKGECHTWQGTLCKLYCYPRGKSIYLGAARIGWSDIAIEIAKEANKKIHAGEPVEQTILKAKAAIKKLKGEFKSVTQVIHRS